MASIRKKRRADGSFSYHVQIRVKGAPPVTETFERKSDAKRWAELTEAAIRERRYFKVFEAQRHTAADAIDRFVKDVLPNRPKQRRDLTSHLRWWKCEVGAHLLSELTPSVLSAARDKLLAGTTVRGTRRAPATVLRTMASLSAVLKVAATDWEWIDRSPMAKISKPRAAEGVVRFLDDAERERLLLACKESSLPCLHTIVLMAICTGMRMSEIMTLRWEQLDIRDELAVGHAQLLKTKNKQMRGVPIAGPALTALRNMSRTLLLAQGTKASLRGLIFPSERLNGVKPVDIRRPWMVAVAKAQLVKFRFHDLRHTAASYMAMNQATPSEIAEVLGHRTLSMVKRYAHLSPAHTASVVARMNSKVFSEGVE